MRKLLLLPLTTLLVVAIVSCNKNGFLDQTVTSSLNEQTVFADSTNSIAFLSQIYSDIGFTQDPRRFGGGGYAAGLDASSDEAEGPNASSTNGFIQFATASVNPTVVPDDAWGIPYKNIRAVNIFLRNLYRMPFSASQKTATESEARFLRAWYYAMMLQHYGGVPLIGDTVYTAENTIPAIRNTYAECVNYILAECDFAASNLPNIQSGSQFGRISRAGCLALKSRVLLFAASPLFNNGGTSGGGALASIVAYPDADNNRWKLAADAAAAVIGLNAHSLYYDSTTHPAEKGFGFQRQFMERFTSEQIISRMMNNNKYLESFWDVPSRGGSGGPFPYQETVDAFGMANGLAITDPASGYDAQNPYSNRDPRLDYTIIHDSTLRPIFGTNAASPVLLYTNLATTPPTSASGDAVFRGTPTGFYIYKMVDREIINNSLGESKRQLPLIRYAEILLNYAEAQNEFLPGPDASVYSAVESIRRRAGLRPYELPAGLSKEQMRDAIRRERQVELMYEGHRFFDVRRWMIAEQTQDQMMHGMEIRRNGAVKTYNIFNVRKHNFTRAMYLWPLPLKEISKSPELLQNPLY
ncbi:MAG: RagB/SusD family nutrient uptake outer membrane protein [Chitinophagaceae bacterium]|nr:MAG: RagB/SusD family nutrient uptake outer membrane protein [Chitinophagaceae bacterium]